MNERTRLLLAIPILALLAILTFLFLVSFSSSNASAACTPPASGDWVVNFGETCVPAGPTYTVDGDLRIMNGGSLTLSGVTIQMASTFDGQRTIEVQTGGTFKVTSSSTITSTNTNFEYKFLVRQGATVQITDSTVKECGYDNTPDDAIGLKIESNAVTIQRSTFQNGYAGLYIKGASPSVDNSSFSGNKLGILIAGAAASPKLYDNDVLNNQNGIYVTDASPIIGNNEISQASDRGIYLLRSNATITGNDIHDNRYGIMVQSSSPRITGNTIHHHLDGIRGFFAEPYIANNIFHHDDRYTIYLVRSGGSIDLNYMNGPPLSQTGIGYAVYLITSTTDVRNNTIVFYNMTGITILAGSDVGVYNNTIDYPEFGFWVESSNVRIEGNTVSHGYYGLSFSKTSGRVGNNKVLNNYYGLEASYVNTTLRVEENFFNLNIRRAITLYDGHPLIINNTFDTNQVGVRALYSRPQIIGNDFIACPMGMDINQESDAYIEGNSMILGNFSIFISRGMATLVNNTITATTNWSVFVTNQSYVRMIGNDISMSGQMGVFIKDSSAWLSNNTISHSGTGISSHEETKVVMDHNRFHNNSLALNSENSDITMDNDIIENQTSYGLMTSSGRLSIKGMLLKDNKYGIYAYMTDLTMKDSVFDDNNVALFLMSNPRVTFDNITITGSDENILNLNGQTAIVTIVGSLFFNNSGRVWMQDSNLDMRSSDYIDNDQGFEITGGSLKLRDCTFERVNTTAIKANKATITMEGSAILDSIKGIEAESSVIAVRSSEVKGSNKTGIQLEATTLTVTDSRITFNQDGILDLGGSSIDVLNCNISSNQVYGLYSDATSTFVRINVTRKVINKDNSFLIHGPLIIEDGGQLYLIRSNIEFFPTFPGEYGLTVRNGGTLVMRELVISSYYTDIGYYMTAQKGSLIEVSNVSMRHCGRGLSGPSSGLLIQTDKNSINDLFLESNEVGLYVMGTYLKASRIRFVDNKFGMMVEDGEVFLEGSKFNQSGDRDIVLIRSTATLLDTKVTYTKVDVQDQNSLFIVMWYLDVTVLWNDGQPVNGAVISIKDQANGVLLSTTDAQGKTPTLTVKEYQQKGPDPSGYYALTPHTVTAKVNELSVDKTQYIGNSTKIMISMLDDKPPVIKVTSPEAGVILYSGKVLFIGTAVDQGSAVERVELSIDGKNWLEANGTQFWSGFMTVPEGVHTVQIRATDSRGNSAIVTVSIEVDLSSQLLVIYAPRDGDIINATTINITGKVHQGGSLLINSQVIHVEDNGNFSYLMELVEGQNVIKAKAFSKDGSETMEKQIVVTRDTLAPTLLLLHPTPNELVNTSTITVTVSASEESTFTINGQSVQAFAGKADGTVELQEGNNNIIIKAVDLAGNSRTYQFNITLDTIRPELKLDKPTTSVFSTTKDKLSILGKTEPGANLTLNGKPLTINADGTFKVKKNLKMGKNYFDLSSRDKSGNVNTIVLEVKRKQEANYLAYAALIAIIIVAAIVADAATVYYFQKYYKPKGPSSPSGKNGETEEEAEEKELMDGLEGEEGWDGKTAPQRREPRRPKPPQEEGGSAGQTEFEEVEDLGDF